SYYRVVDRLEHSVEIGLARPRDIDHRLDRIDRTFPEFDARPDLRGKERDSFLESFGEPFTEISETLHDEIEPGLEHIECTRRDRFDVGHRLERIDQVRDQGDAVADSFRRFADRFLYLIREVFKELSHLREKLGCVLHKDIDLTLTELEIGSYAGKHL